MDFRFAEVEIKIFSADIFKGTSKNFKIKACACDKSGVYIR
jgi:hypothetical protein